MMNVFISVLKKSVVVTGLVEKEGQWVSSDHVASVIAGQKLGGISYKRLRKLGDGQHELPISPQKFHVEDDPSYKPADDAPTHWFAWVGYGVASFLLAAAGYGLCLAVESGYTSPRVHWLIAAVYNMGGKEAVAAVFGGLGCLFFAAAVFKFFRYDPAC